MDQKVFKCVPKDCKNILEAFAAAKKFNLAGKCDKSIISIHKKYSDNWEKIFGKGKKKNEKTINDTGNRRKARDEVSDR